jgi:hypothetical protein
MVNYKEELKRDIKQYIEDFNIWLELEELDKEELEETLNNNLPTALDYGDYGCKDMDEKRALISDCVKEILEEPECREHFEILGAERGDLYV